MLRWWTSEEQVKQSPPVPTHSADLRGRHRIRKGSWGAGTELHVYEVFGRVEAVRRDSGLTVWAASPTACSCCTVAQAQKAWARKAIDHSSVGEIWALFWREQNHMEISNFQFSLLQRSSSYFHGVWNGKKRNLNLKPKLCFIIF